MLDTMFDKKQVRALAGMQKHFMEENGLATKEDIKNLATKEDIKSLEKHLNLMEKHINLMFWILVVLLVPVLVPMLIGAYSG